MEEGIPARSADGAKPGVAPQGIGHSYGATRGHPRPDISARWPFGPEAFVAASKPGPPRAQIQTVYASHAFRTAAEREGEHLRPDPAEGRAAPSSLRILPGGGRLSAGRRGRPARVSDQDYPLSRWKKLANCGIASDRDSGRQTGQRSGGTKGALR